MFEKKEIIYSEAIGVCQVAEITKLPAKNGDQILYYGLRSVFDSKKVSYIPVEHHQVQLRELISSDEALKMTEEEIEKLSPLRRKEIEYVLSHRK